MSDQIINMVLDQLVSFAGPYTDVALAVVYIVAGLVIAKVFNLFLKGYLHKISARTKNTLDDIILPAVGRVVFIGVFLYAVYLAANALNILSAYHALVNQIFAVVFTFFAAYSISKIINMAIVWWGAETAKKTGSKKMDQLVPVFKKAVYLVVFLVAVLVLMNQLGIEITALVATLGIGGLAIALALQPTLSNLFAGAYVMMDRPIKIGDYIELESGDTGYVKGVGWRSTKIRTWDNNLIVIPNEKISTGRLINYSSPQQAMSFVVPVGVGYGEDLEKVERVALDVAKKVLKKTGKGAEDSEPRIRFKEFGDSNINFSVIFKVKTRVDKFGLRHEFVKMVKARFDKEGIEIAWPMRKLYFDDRQFKKLTKRK